MNEATSPEFFALQEAVAGRYSLERELGRGGMGVVLLARDVALDRLVAIKLLPPDLALDAARRERFLHEARTAAGLSHPNIVPIHAVEEHGELVFFVMGYIDGETLHERVQRAGPLSPRGAMKLLQEVTWALAYAHQRGIVHRDVKPDNIMIERATDRALVTDFGIARVATREPQGEPGEVVGTARYMSPEQASGGEVDARSDLYSLGATAFFCLTGRAPFEAANVPALLAKHVTEPAPRLAAVRSEVPAKLAAAIDRCLEKDPAARFPSGEELARAIGEVRGRELRAPPLVRNFLRNAQVTTAVVLTSAVVSSGGNADGDAINVIVLIVVGQLVFVARRLLREGYKFEDIREALLGEAQAQEEEADAAGQRKFSRWFNSRWHRIWASRFGKFFFRVAGVGVRPPKRPAVPSTEATELVLGQAAADLFDGLPSATRHRLPDVPKVIERLERDAEALRKRGETGERLATAVAALENVRLGLLRLRAGAGSVDDLTANLERARAIGDQIDAEIAGRREVDELLRNA
jgi:serine/threonine-protein kinase